MSPKILKMRRLRVNLRIQRHKLSVISDGDVWNLEEKNQKTEAVKKKKKHSNDKQMTHFPAYL